MIRLIRTEQLWLKPPILKNVAQESELYIADNFNSRIHLCNQGHIMTLVTQVYTTVKIISDVQFRFLSYIFEYGRFQP